MRVKLDENFPRGLIEILASAGHDAETVLDEGPGGADDDSLFAAARDGDRILFTLDRGFGDIRRYPPGTHPGIVEAEAAAHWPRRTQLLRRRTRQ